jgi:lipoic acid synthetase
VEYEEACHLQEELAAARVRGTVGDLLLLVQHPPVITVGRGGGWEDIVAPAARLRQAGVRVLPTDRGGRATYHGPGQLVAYPILEVPDGDLHAHVWRLEETAIQVLASYGLTAGRLEEHPGVWLRASAAPVSGAGWGPQDGEAKIAAVGVAVRDGVTRHGLALNVAPHMSHFDLLIPCGISGRGVTSMERELGQELDITEVARCLVDSFARVFGRQVAWGEPAELVRLAALPAAEEGAGGVDEQPQWLWQRVSAEAEAAADRIAQLLAGHGLHTVCQEARCPNLAECFGRGTATFLILGNRCTRACRFCAVGHGRPAPYDATEPERVAEAAARLGLRHVVVTSVTRDDLPDGGAGQFAATLRVLRRRLPEARLEVLIPDLGGSCGALEAILDARPDVLNHNLETVPRLYPLVRPGANYRRSMALLAWAKSQAPGLVTKSGLMLGLGERAAEILQVLCDLRQARCDLLTMGQYLQPSDQQLPVVRHVPPEEFGWFQKKAEQMGYLGVASGPLVRSSHRAEALWAEAADHMTLPAHARQRERMFPRSRMESESV